MKTPKNAFKSPPPDDRREQRKIETVSAGIFVSLPSSQVGQGKFAADFLIGTAKTPSLSSIKLAHKGQFFQTHKAHTDFYRRVETRSHTEEGAESDAG